MGMANDKWDYNLPKIKIRPRKVWFLLLLVILGLVGFGGLTSVDSTERSVVFNKMNGNLSILTPGYHYVLPFLESSTKYDVREQAHTESAVGISLDLQETTTEVTVLYSPDATQIQTIHQKLGTSYESKIVTPAIQSCVKNAVSHYNVEQLTGNVRAQVNQDISDCIRTSIQASYLIVDKVSVTDFDFSAQFNKAIEAKAIAQQAAQEEKNRLEQVKYQANQTIVQAQAQAEAIRLLTNASSSQQESNAYLYLQWLKVWDGHLPSVVSGDNQSLLITPPTNNTK